MPRRDPKLNYKNFFAARPEPITQYFGLVTKSGIVLGKHLTPDPITDMYRDIFVSIPSLYTVQQRFGCERAAK